MSRVSEIIHNAITPISDQGNVLLSKGTVYLGVSGASVGVVDGVTSTMTSSAQSNIGIICGIGGFLCLAIKTAVDIYFASKKNKREQERRAEESALNNKKLGDK